MVTWSSLPVQETSVLVSPQLKPVNSGVKSGGYILNKESFDYSSFKDWKILLS